jgi:hypothetical protein
MAWCKFLFFSFESSWCGFLDCSLAYVVLMSDLVGRGEGVMNVRGWLSCSDCVQVVIWCYGFFWFAFKFCLLLMWVVVQFVCIMLDAECAKGLWDVQRESVLVVEGWIDILLIPLLCLGCSVWKIGKRPQGERVICCLPLFVHTYWTSIPALILWQTSCSLTPNVYKLRKSLWTIASLTRDTQFPFQVKYQ